MKTIIQIGIANAEDHVKEFMLSHKDEYFIHLIEPVKDSNELINSSYAFTENKQLWNFAVSTTNGYVDFYSNKNEGGNNQHASVNINHLIKHGHNENDIVKNTIPCFDLKTIMKVIIQNTDIEYLFIDTEGHDCDIILNTQFDEINVNNVIFEVTHSDGPFSVGEKFTKTKQHLANYGYHENTNSIFNSNGNICMSK